MHDVDVSSIKNEKFDLVRAVACRGYSTCVYAVKPPSKGKVSLNSAGTADVLRIGEDSRTSTISLVDVSRITVPGMILPLHLGRKYRKKKVILVY